MDMEKFIGAVYIRTALWDKQHCNHHNRYILDRLWKEIGREFGISRDCARGRWKALRDKFRSTLTKINQRQQSGEGDPNDYIISWPYYRSLLFIKEQFNDSKLTNHSAYNDSVQDPDENDKGSDNFQDASLSGFDEGEKLSSTCTDFPLPRNNNMPSQAPQEDKKVEEKNEGKKRRRPSDDIVKDLVHVENKKLKYLKSLRDQLKIANEDMCFFNSIIPHVKHLNSMEKMAFRIQVLRCVEEVIAKKNNAGSINSNDSQGTPHLNGASSASSSKKY